MTGALSPSHWLIILVVVLLLFGAKRLPDAARGLGRSMRILKAETTAMSADDPVDGRAQAGSVATVPPSDPTTPGTTTTAGTTTGAVSARTSSRSS